MNTKVTGGFSFVYHWHHILYLEKHLPRKKKQINTEPSESPKQLFDSFLNCACFKCVVLVSFTKGDKRDADAKRAYESLMILTLTVPSGPVWDNFVEEVIFRAQRDYNHTFTDHVSLRAFFSVNCGRRKSGS